MMQFNNVQELLNCKEVFLFPVKLNMGRIQTLGKRAELHKILSHRSIIGGYVFEFAFLGHDLTIMNNKWSIRPYPKVETLQDFPVVIPEWFATEQDCIDYINDTKQIKDLYVQQERIYDMSICDSWLNAYKSVIAKEFPECKEAIEAAFGKIK